MSLRTKANLRLKFLNGFISFDGQKSLMEFVRCGLYFTQRKALTEKDEALDASNRYKRKGYIYFLASYI
ncbi:hypothetical protein H5410_049223 [Solanum commersonii]|uniref:Uncharacterized protein n=1 Tax=Solanum commersonii TaxID=4109 RepID=A0A9J5XLR0_SOLCO|nr:hypothetical protein H5410_049223 [Solanum commersonii]